MKPSLVVETGVEKGLGAVLLCAALRKNSEEGVAGRYLGTDIDSTAGGLLCGVYSEHGKVAYGDSIETLRTLEEPIDLFINDSDHSAEYEAREYRMVESLLHAKSFVIGDNAAANSVLADFSAQTNRSFILVPEYPVNHWYRGAGVGIAYRR